MNITTETCIKSYRNIHMGFGTTTDFKQIDSELSKTMTNKLLKYALNRLDNDLRELVINKGYRVDIQRTINREQQKLNDSEYQVNFISNSGLMISVDHILLKDYKPHLDHGVSLAEGQF